MVIVLYYNLHRQRADHVTCGCGNFICIRREREWVSYICRVFVYVNWNCYRSKWILNTSHLFQVDDDDSGGVNTYMTMSNFRRNTTSWSLLRKNDNTHPCCQCAIINITLKIIIHHIYTFNWFNYSVGFSHDLCSIINRQDLFTIQLNISLFISINNYFTIIVCSI